MAMRDIVYFWVGTRRRGEWIEIPASSTKDAEQICSEIEAEGYTAVTGRQSIGAPEGPPPGPGLKTRRRDRKS